MKRDARQKCSLFYSQQLRKRLPFWRASLFIFGRLYFVRALVANWTRSELTRSKCEWSRIWTIYNVDETNSRLVCPCSLACNKFSNHKFIINKHALVSWGLLRNKLQFCLLIRNETSIKKKLSYKMQQDDPDPKAKNSQQQRYTRVFCFKNCSDLLWQFFLRSLKPEKAWEKDCFFVGYLSSFSAVRRTLWL